MLKLYAHPLSSYCQKALAALYENDLAFDFAMLDGSDPVDSEFRALWPIAKFPILTDDERVIVEATIVIEYLDLNYPGNVRFLPDDPAKAIEVRMLDRFFDNYVMAPMQAIVDDALKPAERRDPVTVTNARGRLDTAYGVLDRWMAGRDWAAAGQFSLADLAASPALLYAHWTHAIGEQFEHVHAYRTRLLERRGYARALDEARPYRAMFPLGAPTDRD